MPVTPVPDRRSGFGRLLFIKHPYTKGGVLRLETPDTSGFVVVAGPQEYLNGRRVRRPVRITESVVDGCETRPRSRRVTLPVVQSGGFKRVPS